MCVSDCLLSEKYKQPGDENDNENMACGKRVPKRHTMAYESYLPFRQ